MFQISNFFHSKLHFNASAQPAKQPEVNPFHVSSSVLFDLKPNDQVSFLQNLEKLRTEVKTKEAFLDEIKSKTESIGLSLEDLKLVADMGQILCDVHKDSSTYVIQKTQISTKLNSETSKYNYEYLKLKEEIQNISSQLVQFQTEIASCFSQFRQNQSENSFQKIHKEWESKIHEFKSLVGKIESAHKEYWKFKNSLHLDEFENKLKEDSASSALAAYQMTKGRYLYSAKREFQNSESIDFTEYFKKINHRDYILEYNSVLIDCIEKIQSDVNHGVPAKKIIESYLQRLAFMGHDDSKNFLYKVIVASIHKNPLSRYRNEKTKTISNIISNLTKLVREKTSYLQSKFSIFHREFDEKIYFGTIGKNGQMLSPFHDRLKEFISQIKIMNQKLQLKSYDNYLSFKLNHKDIINKIESLHIIKDGFLSEIIKKIFILIQDEYKFSNISTISDLRTSSILSFINHLEYKVLESVKPRGTLTLREARISNYETYVGSTIVGKPYYVTERHRYDLWGADPWDRGPEGMDRDGYYSVKKKMIPLHPSTGIFYDEQGREVHRINC